MNKILNILIGLCIVSLVVACASESKTVETQANKVEDTKAVSQTANKSTTTNRAKQGEGKPVLSVNKENKKNKIPGTKTASAGGGKVNWVPVDELEAKLKKDPRPVMVDLYTNWCGWCKRMDKDTFEHPEIASMLNDKFHAVKFNAEMKEPINFQGKSYDFVAAGRKGYNKLAHSWGNRGGRMGYPTIAFLDKGGQKIEAMSGYKKPHQFEPALKYIESGNYKGKTFNQFQQSYKSSIPAPEGEQNARGNKTPGKRTIQVPAGGGKKTIDLKKLLEQQQN